MREEEKMEGREVRSTKYKVLSEKRKTMGRWEIRDLGWPGFSAILQKFTEFAESGVLGIALGF